MAIWSLCVVFLIAFWRSQGLKLSRPPKSFHGYFRTWFRQVVQSRHPISHTLPGGPNWNEGLQAIGCAGLALSWALIFGSIAAIHAWFATNETAGSFYQRLYATLRFGKVNYLVWLVTPFGFLMGAMIFFLSEYHFVRMKSFDASRN